MFAYTFTCISRSLMTFSYKHPFSVLLSPSAWYNRAYFKEILQLQRTKNFRPQQYFQFPVKKILDIPSFFHFIDQKFLTTFFLVISSISDVSARPSKRCRYNCTTNFLQHSFSKFHGFHPSFLHFSTVAIPNLQLQLHNCHFTTANYILQLQKLSSVAR